MRIAALLVVLSACGAAFAQAQPPNTVTNERKIDNKKDDAALQGTWTVTKTSGFKATPPQELKDLRLTIKGDRMTAHYGRKSAEATFKLDSTTTPRHIDITITDGPEDVKGKTFECIYLLEGNVLHIAFRKPGEKRPSEFITRNTEDLHEVWLKKAEK